MSNKRIEIELTTLGKSFAIFVLLLILSFVLGLYLGRESRGNAPASHEENGISEQMAACTYKVQELTAKFTALSQSAREKGLLDQHGLLIRGVTCTVPPAAEGTKAVADKTDTSLSTDSEQKKPLPSSSGDAPSLHTSLPPATTTKLPSCKYALQIYAGRTREEALEVQSRSKIKPTRLTEGTVNGVTWHRLRYGCYPDKVAAEAAINDLLQMGARPIIVREDQP